MSFRRFHSDPKIQHDIDRAVQMRVRFSSQAPSIVHPWERALVSPSLENIRAKCEPLHRESAPRMSFVDIILKEDHMTVTMKFSANTPVGLFLGATSLREHRHPCVKFQ